MTDSPRGMEGPANRIRKLVNTAIPAGLLAGMIAVVGCGGGGGSSTAAKAPAPVKQSSSAASGKLVTAQGTAGVIGPAGRVTANSQQFDDKTGKISPQANHRPGAGKKGGVSAGDSCSDRDLAPSDADIDQLNAAILCLVNGERTDNGGLPQLAQSSELAQAASGMCQRMTAEHFFSHATPDGKSVVDRIQPTGYIPGGGDWVVGENLAWGSGALSTPQAIVNGWMNSPGHRANILAPDYKDIGLASCMGAPLADRTDGTVYVNNFGAKAGADVNAVLPEHGQASSGTNAAAASTVAGTKKTAASRTKAKRRARCVRKASHLKTHHARVAARRRCRHL